MRSVGEGLLATVTARPSLAPVAVRASVEKGSEPPAVVEGMVAKTNTDDVNAIIYPYYIVAFAIQA